MKPSLKRPCKPSVIIVRETEEQVAASGCCGKFEGDFARCGDAWIFPERRLLKERMGSVIRRLHQEFGQNLELTVVDPRNQLYLLPRIIREVWCHRPPLRQCGSSLMLLFAAPAVLINGAIVCSGRVPDPEEIVQAVHLARAPWRRAPAARCSSPE